MTGGAGFIGSNLVDALLQAGNTVCAVDDLSRGRREQLNPQAEFVQLDVTDAALLEVVGRQRPHVVFHLAAQIDVRNSVSDPVKDADANVVGTVNVLHACAEAGVRRLVLASSGGAIYGDTDVIPTPEEHPAVPASPYGTSKLCAEEYGRMFERMRGLEFVAMRYANVYGPRQDPHGEAGVVAIFSERLLRQQPATLNGDGKQTRDYVYVDDVVDANLRAAAAPRTGTFNIGTGVETDVNQLWARLRTLSGSTIEAEHGPAKPGEQARSCLDVTCARAQLGWQPAVDLDEGLQRTLDFFRTR